MARTAAVVGGGIGGLAVANGLIQAGWHVTVLERAASQPTTGTGLGIWPSALGALDRLGLGNAARSTGRRQPSGTIRRPDGSRVATIDVNKVEKRQGEPVYLLSRPALLGLLAGALPAGIVRYATHVDDPASLRTECDVVIGADGINSAVRRAFFGDQAQLRYSGVIGWRGTVALDIDSGGETWGRGVKFGLTPQESGRTNWYAVLRTAEDYQPPDGDVAELRRLFGNWHQPIPSILDLVEDDNVLRHALHYLTPLPSFTTGNVALLGDAAHAMTPDLGQGACQAMIDAVALTDALTSAADIPSALRRYDDSRRRTTQRMGAMSLRINKLAQMRQFLPVRDFVVRAALAFGPPR